MPRSSKRRSLNDLKSIKAKIRKIEESLHLTNDITTSESEPDLEIQPCLDGRTQSYRRIISSSESDENDQTADVSHVSSYQRLLGIDPDSPLKKSEPLNDALVSRWTSYLTTGLQKDERETIIESIRIPDNCLNLSAPILNQEINHLLPNQKVQDDSVKAKIQTEIGLGLSALGYALTALLARKDNDDEPIIMSLANSAKLLGNAHHLMSIHRRFAIRSHLDTSIQKTTKECKIDSHLFGKDFADKCMAAQNVKKTSLALAAKPKLPKPVAGPSNTMHKNSLNYERPGIRTRLKQLTQPVQRENYARSTSQYRRQETGRRGGRTRQDHSRRQ